ncbi:MAG: metal-dependent hydrolase, partial [Promethearchaeota archaeon]
MVQKKGFRPKNLQIIVREIVNDYELSLKQNPFWIKNDPIETHFFNAFQSTFPEGEKLFIQAAIDGANILKQQGKMHQQLVKDLEGFIKQEARHSQQHTLWTSALIHIGYEKMGLFNDQLRRFRVWSRKRVPLILRLAFTAAAEHYTASLAFMFARIKPEILESSSLPFRRLLLYHAMEEIEHKSVCYDVYQIFSGNYCIRLFGLFLVSLDLAINIFLRFRYLLKKDGIWDRNHVQKFRKYLIGREGLIRGLLFQILTYLKPSFHPWDTDERIFINKKFYEFQADLGIKPLKTP